MFVGSAYVNPYDCLQTNHIIKGGDEKRPTLYNRLNWKWGGGSQDDEYVAVTSNTTGNLLNLVISPKSLTYIEDNSTTKLQNSNSFLGATFIYNRGGESSILIGLESGLPLLKGHLPNFTEKGDRMAATIHSTVFLDGQNLSSSTSQMRLIHHMHSVV